ncbi:MAG: glycoside hydrolase family 99-like domain-containing protein [Deltaproteobacteria bacterium]|jgi:lipopolysaccharide biosynthesis protein|nr:glycoside hydrolase family 99-like domain-containing protein [Deltaproteobacteria bacterium]
MREKDKTKVIALYLPQYHAIPENDAWWGKGFTEWDNVKSALPLFQNHYQPHIPHKRIGYYDLSDAATLERQHALALRYGVSAFCYYYYNFSGFNPLERPLLTISNSKAIKNDFCLCWANHDWTRTWFGQDKTILLRQEYSADLARVLFEDACKYFQNERYITIDGKPLFLVFRPEENPMMREYAAIWRELAVKNGFPGIFLVAVEALIVGADPAGYGFDAAVEFAPDWTCTELSAKKDPNPRVFDYQATLRNMLNKTRPAYTRMRCAFPGWDNTPRYKERAVLFENTSMGAFKYALAHLKEYTQKNLPDNLQYVFINAWNEWGEGCHLEPDEKNSYAHLGIVKEIFGTAP